MALTKREARYSHGEDGEIIRENRSGVGRDRKADIKMKEYRNWKTMEIIQVPTWVEKHRPSLIGKDFVSEIMDRYDEADTRKAYMDFKEELKYR